MKQKKTLHLLTLGLLVTQNNFVTRVLFILHKPLMIPAIPAKWPMYMDLIQKLPLFVSHIYIAVMQLTALSSYMYQHDVDWVLRVEPVVRLSGYKNPSSAFTLSCKLVDHSLCSLDKYNTYIALIVTCKMQKSSAELNFRWLIQRWVS